MSAEEIRLLNDMAERLLADHLGDEAPGDGDWSPDLWQAASAAGLPLTLLSEANGGLGLGPGAAWGVLAAFGRHAAPAPLAESLVGQRLLADHGLAVPGAAAESPVALALPVTDGTAAGQTAVEAERSDGGWRLQGSAVVPGGRHAAVAVVPVTADGRAHIAAVLLDDLVSAAARTVGPDPADRFDFAGLALSADAVAPARDDEVLLRQGAILRAVQMAGALDRVLGLTAGYAQDRVQFGRPLAAFQAIQQQLAELAAEAALATAAARRALDHLDDPDAGFAVAAAKSQTGEAASRVAAIAHQVHGAIGFTEEYALQRLTRRLWAWRDEFGSEAWWQRRLGGAVAAAGPDRLWPTLAAG